MPKSNATSNMATRCFIKASNLLFGSGGFVSDATMQDPRGLYDPRAPLKDSQ